MNPSLKGKILLAKSRTEEATTNIVLSVIAGVNKSLGDLTRATGEQQLEQHGKISEAVAHLGTKEVDALNRRGPHLKEEHLVQNDLDGAIVIGNLRLVECSLSVKDTRADINGETPFFGKPLHIAAVWGHADIVEYLLDKGADLCATSSYHTYERWDEELECLNKEHRHAYRCPDDTALRAAALGGHNGFIRVLLSPNYQPSFKGQKNAYHRAMMAAARGGHLDTIDLLQSAKKSVSNLKQVQQEMLYEAADHNREALVRMQLDNGADVNFSAFTGAMAIPLLSRLVRSTPK